MAGHDIDHRVRVRVRRRKANLAILSKMSRGHNFKLFDILKIHLFNRLLLNIYLFLSWLLPNIHLFN